MTGLDRGSDALVEVACVVTDAELRELDVLWLEEPLAEQQSHEPLEQGAVHRHEPARVSRLEAEPRGRSTRARLLPAGRLVVADASTALAVLFGELAAGHRAGSSTQRLTLFAVQVAGVPTIYAEEALWSCRTALERP